MIIISSIIKVKLIAYADPESFVRWCPTLTVFFLLFFIWGIFSAIIGPPAKHHLNGVEVDPTLNAGLEAVIIQGIRTSIATKPYIFVIFQGGGVRTLCPLSESANG